MRIRDQDMFKKLNVLLITLLIGVFSTQNCEASPFSPFQIPGAAPTPPGGSAFGMRPVIPQGTKLRNDAGTISVTVSGVPVNFQQFSKGKVAEIEIPTPTGTTDLTIKFLFMIGDSPDNEYNSFKINNVAFENFRTYVYNASGPQPGAGSWYKQVYRGQIPGTAGWPDQYGWVTFNFKVDQNNKSLTYVSKNGQKRQLPGYDGKKFKFTLQNGLDEPKNNEFFGIGNFQASVRIQEGPSIYHSQLVDTSNQRYNAQRAKNNAYDSFRNQQRQMNKGVNSRFGNVNKNIGNVQNQVRANDKDIENHKKMIEELKAQIKIQADNHKRLANKTKEIIENSPEIEFMSMKPSEIVETLGTPPFKKPEPVKPPVHKRPPPFAKSSDRPDFGGYGVDRPYSDPRPLKRPRHGDPYGAPQSYDFKGTQQFWEQRSQRPQSSYPTHSNHQGRWQGQPHMQDLHSGFDERGYQDLKQRVTPVPTGG